VGRGVKQDPSLAELQPYKAIFERDPAFFAGLVAQEPAVVESLLQAFTRSWAGATPAEFDAQVPGLDRGRPATQARAVLPDLVYQPILELFDLLRNNGFRLFVCSGGGRDFMRVFAEETWGVFEET
jgi:phosphoglycolate phosphatase-like HAD superfamily hydrolase